MGEAVSVKAMTGVKTVAEPWAEGTVKTAMATAEPSGRGADLRQGNTEQYNR